MQIKENDTPTYFTNHKMTENYITEDHFFKLQFETLWQDMLIHTVGHDEYLKNEIKDIGIQIVRVIIIS